MRFYAVATDYDGTLAHEGRVEPAVIRLLEEVRASGRKLIMVTGRHMPELNSVFARVALFDLVVAENGALLHHPTTGEDELLSEPIPPSFIHELLDRGLGPLSLGRGIVATSRCRERDVIEAIADLGLDLQAIPNKNSVMVLRAGVDKGTGLKTALRELDLSPRNLVGLGDAENDYDFLRLCECSVAVANAIDSLKGRVSIVTQSPNGGGVSEILRALLKDDLLGWNSDHAALPRPQSY
jgi:hydroxymethylpyrimidine pyrophosphatase-like HAD family hydrolase